MSPALTLPAQPPPHGAPISAVPPVSVAEPPAGVAPIPLVCDSPHSGTDYPADFHHAVDRAALRQSEDTHVDALWAAVPHVGGTLVRAHFPRSYIDPNRDEADIDLSMFDGDWPFPVRPMPRSLELGMGLVWRLTPEGLPIYARRLSANEVAQRIAACWMPYRHALQTHLRQAAARFGGWWHLNLHSMPGNAYERLGLPPTRALADIVLGDRYGTTCDGAFLDCVKNAFTRRGYSVAVNDPYEGLELIRVNGQPSLNRHSLQVELNRALYMDEKTRQPSAGFERLQADIGAVLADIAAFVAAQARR